MSKTHPYLDPKNDLLFKRVFGEHKHLLISFLNALLPLPDDAPIVSLEYLSPEQVPEVPGLFKNSIVDVKCVDSRDRIFIVEMQIMWSASFDKRIVFGASQAYTKQLEPGMDYSELQPVYALALINGVFDQETPEYYHHYKIAKQDNPSQKLRGLEFVLIELPKFKPENRTDKRMKTLWLKYLSQINSKTQTVDPELTQDDDIASALEMVKVSALSSNDIEIYHVSEDKARIEATVMADSRELGKAEGKAEGLVEGEARGEIKKALAIAKQLLAAGMAMEDVAKITQLAMSDLKLL